MELSDCRKRLDEIDGQLVRLFEERMNVCGQVAGVKAATGAPVYDAAREEEKLLRAAGQLTDMSYAQDVRELFKQLMTMSRRYQYSLLGHGQNAAQTGFEKQKALEKEGARVVYQGVPGAFGHEAALFFKGSEDGVFAADSFRAAVEAVEAKKADFAVLPIENSTAGTVTDSMDLLSGHDVCIVEEMYLPVRHALLAPKGAEMNGIKRIYSHPQAIAQCAGFFEKHPEIEAVPAKNTAAAARMVAEKNDPSTAAIASVHAGRIYGLQTLISGLQDTKTNMTRFVVLSGKRIYLENAGKISIFFCLKHRFGTLFSVLGHLAYNHVNMIKIESRPVRERDWEYSFYVDIEGSLSDPAIQNAINSIKNETESFKLLGSY